MVVSGRGVPLLRIGDGEKLFHSGPRIVWWTNGRSFLNSCSRRSVLFCVNSLSANHACSSGRYCSFKELPPVHYTLLQYSRGGNRRFPPRLEISLPLDHQRFIVSDLMQIRSMSPQVRGEQRHRMCRSQPPI